MENPKQENKIHIQSPYPPYYPNYPAEDDEIDLYELWLILKKRFKTVIATVAIFTILGILYIVITPPIYKTEAKIFPLIGNEKSSIASIIGDLPITLPGMNPSTLTVETILNSRTLKERVITNLNLLPELFPSLWDNATKSWKEPEEAPTILDGVKKLDKLISISSDKKTGTITISVEFPRHPEMTYLIANAILMETQKILDEKTWTLSKKYRIFLEKQIDLVLNKLKLLEEVYKKFLKGEIKEVPIIISEEFIRELKNYQEQLGENGNRKKLTELKIFQLKLMQMKKNLQNPADFRNIPDYQFNYQRLEWQLNLIQKLLQTLFRQYEIAKQNEMKEKIAFQIVDPPYIPDKRKPDKPKKALILAVSTISGLFLGIFLAFFMEWLNNVKNRRKYKEE